MAAAPAQPLDVVGMAFVQHYYRLFDSDRTQLAPLYQNTSMLTFEKQAFQGTQAIIGKLTSLAFEKVAHAIRSIDCQPSGCGGILVQVVGELKVDENPNPLKFSQLFHLMPTAPNSNNYWVHNDVFRLNYG